MSLSGQGRFKRCYQRAAESAGCAVAHNQALRRTAARRPCRSKRHASGGEAALTAVTGKATTSSAPIAGALTEFCATRKSGTAARNFESAGRQGGKRPSSRYSGLSRSGCRIRTEVRRLPAPRGLLELQPTLLGCRQRFAGIGESLRCGTEQRRIACVTDAGRPGLAQPRSLRLERRDLVRQHFERPLIIEIHPARTARRRRFALAAVRCGLADQPEPWRTAGPRGAARSLSSHVGIAAGILDPTAVAFGDDGSAPPRDRGSRGRGVRPAAPCRGTPGQLLLQQVERTREITEVVGPARRAPAGLPTAGRARASVSLAPLAPDSADPGAGLLGAKQEGLSCRTPITCRLWPPCPPLSCRRFRRSMRRAKVCCGSRFLAPLVEVDGLPDWCRA